MAMTLYEVAKDIWAGEVPNGMIISTLGNDGREALCFVPCTKKDFKDWITEIGAVVYDDSENEHATTMHVPGGGP